MRIANMREIPRKKALDGVLNRGNAYAEVYDTITASIQPMSGTATAQAYGLQPSQMRLLLALPDCDLENGDGLCVEVPATENPDFRVIHPPERWARHVRVHLQWIPDDQRGADL